jgi:hypothetical protein
MTGSKTDLENFQYHDLAVQATEDFLPDEHDNEAHQSILFVTFLQILASYQDSEDEPFVNHPGDEYIIGTLIDMVEYNPMTEWIEWYTDYGEISELEFQKFGNEFIDILEAEYGEAVENHVPVRIIPTSLGSPGGSLTKEDLTDYYPGDGMYRDRQESNI